MEWTSAITSLVARISSRTRGNPSHSSSARDVSSLDDGENDASASRTAFLERGVEERRRPRNGCELVGGVIGPVWRLEFFWLFLGSGLPSRESRIKSIGDEEGGGKELNNTKKGKGCVVGRRMNFVLDDSPSS